MKQNKCWECNEPLVKKKVPYTFQGTCIGEFTAEVCTSCKEIIFSEKTSRHIDRVISRKK